MLSQHHSAIPAPYNPRHHHGTLSTLTVHPKPSVVGRSERHQTYCRCYPSTIVLSRTIQPAAPSRHPQHSHSAHPKPSVVGRSERHQTYCRCYPSTIVLSQHHSAIPAPYNPRHHHGTLSTLTVHPKPSVVGRSERHQTYCRCYPSTIRSAIPAPYNPRHHHGTLSTLTVHPKPSVVGRSERHQTYLRHYPSTMHSRSYSVSQTFEDWSSSGIHNGSFDIAEVALQLGLMFMASCNSCGKARKSARPGK